MKISAFFLLDFTNINCKKMINIILFLLNNPFPSIYSNDMLKILEKKNKCVTVRHHRQVPEFFFSFYPHGILIEYVKAILLVISI